MLCALFLNERGDSRDALSQQTVAPESVDKIPRAKRVMRDRCDCSALQPGGHCSRVPHVA